MEFQESYRLPGSLQITYLFQFLADFIVSLGNSSYLKKNDMSIDPAVILNSC